jgi:hypothetical protein
MRRYTTHIQGDLTLLFGLSAKTVSECTFLLFNRPQTLSLTARNAAASTCLTLRTWNQESTRTSNPITDGAG